MNAGMGRTGQKSRKVKKRFNAAEHLVHTTKTKSMPGLILISAFPKMPSYLQTGRPVQHALGSVSSYRTRLEQWKAEGQKEQESRILNSEQYAMPVFYHDVMYRENTEGKDAAFLKLYDGHDWKWFCCAAETYGYGIFKKTLVRAKKLRPQRWRKRHRQIFSAFYVCGRGNTLNRDTCQRTNDLQRGSRHQYGCSLYHHASRRNYPGKKVY